MSSFANVRQPSNYLGGRIKRKRNRPSKLSDVIYSSASGRTKAAGGQKLMSALTPKATELLCCSWFLSSGDVLRRLFAKNGHAP
jgi:hypothetical protein